MVDLKIADALNQIGQAVIIKPAPFQLLLQREKILRVGAQRPAGLSNQRRDSLRAGVGLITKASAVTLRPSASFSSHQVGR